MVAFGEEMTEVRQLLEYLLEAGCDHITIGQYQQPTRDYYPVIKYYHPDEVCFPERVCPENGVSTC